MYFERADAKNLLEEMNFELPPDYAITLLLSR